MESAHSYLKVYKYTNVNVAAEEKLHLYFCTVLLVFFQTQKLPLFQSYSRLVQVPK